VALALFGLPAPLRRLLTRRLNPLLRHGGRRWWRRWCPEFLYRRARRLNPLLGHRRRGRSTEFLHRRFDALLRHFTHRWRSRHSDFRSGPWRFRLTDDLRRFAFAGRWHRTFHALNILHFPTRLPFLRLNHRPGLTLFGTDIRRRHLATHGGGCRGCLWWAGWYAAFDPWITLATIKVATRRRRLSAVGRRIRRLDSYWFLARAAGKSAAPIVRLSLGGFRRWLANIRWRAVASRLNDDRSSRCYFHRAATIFGALTHFG
jgi:hypothetical protein